MGAGPGQPGLGGMLQAAVQGLAPGLAGPVGGLWPPQPFGWQPPPAAPGWPVAVPAAAGAQPVGAGWPQEKGDASAVPVVALDMHDQALLAELGGSDPAAQEDLWDKIHHFNRHRSAGPYAR